MRLLFPAAALLVLAACDAGEPADAADGEVSFLLNGEPWPADDPPYVDRTLYGYGVSALDWIEGRYPLYRTIYFIVPDAEWDGVGRYPLDFGIDGRGSPQIGYFIEMNGDEIVTRYEPLAGGELEVTRYDEATGEIEGRFEGVYVIDPGDTEATYRLLPDTLRVTEGRFRAVVEDRR